MEASLEMRARILAMVVMRRVTMTTIVKMAINIKI